MLSNRDLGAGCYPDGGRSAKFAHHPWGNRPVVSKKYGASVQVVYSTSKTLRREIEQGDPIDLFLAAGIKEVESPHEKGLPLECAPQVYAQTSLVLVMCTDSHATSISFHDALPNRATRIALGDPRTSSLGEITARVPTKFDTTYENLSHLVHGRQCEELVNLLHTGKRDP